MRFTTLILLVLTIFWALPSLSSAAKRKLNNFVTELLDEKSPAAKEFTVTRDRAGWLLLRIQSAGETALMLNGEALPLQAVTINDDIWRESMQLVAAGEHRIDLSEGVDRLQVRTIPEIRYCKFQYDPWVYQYGAYDWEFLQRNTLPHVNAIVGGEKPDQSRFAEPWRAMGRRWIVEVMAPGMTDETPPSSDPANAKMLMIDAGKLDTAWIDGVLLDEYFPSKAPIFPLAIAGLKAVREDPAYKNKSVEPYVANDPLKMADFLRDAARQTDRIFIEMYNAERKTEEEARAYLQKEIVEDLTKYRSCVDKDRQQVFGIALGQMSGPPETLNVTPQGNYRVFQDMEFNLLATSPEVNQLDAIFEYTSGYAEEETIRWVGQLYRHYCIEGSTARLSNEPYVAEHLRNGDFADGTNGWMIDAAGPDAVAIRTVEGNGKRQGFYKAAPGTGDPMLVMTRDENRPNTIEQQIRNLVPGKLYALRVYSTGLFERESPYGNPVFNDVTKPGIVIDGAETVPSRSLDHLYRSIHTKKVMFYVYHLRLFRATGTTAELSISDWNTPQNPGGNPGRPTAINFVEVQPYLE